MTGGVFYTGSRFHARRGVLGSQTSLLRIADHLRTTFLFATKNRQGAAGTRTLRESATECKSLSLAPIFQMLPDGGTTI